MEFVWLESRTNTTAELRARLTSRCRLDVIAENVLTALVVYL